MRAARVILSCLAVAPIVGAAGIANAQQLPSYPNMPDNVPPNGVIEGKVRLQSGHFVSANVKVILSTKQSILQTVYTNNNGEFRFAELREGIYYVEVVPDTKVYNPVYQQVWLKRGEQRGLSIYLSIKDESVTKPATVGTVSVAELSRNVPASAKKKYERASRLIRKGEIREAIKDLEQAIAIAPDYLMARNDLGVQYLKVRRLDDAAEQFTAAIEKNLKYFSPRLNLGLVLVEQARHSEAIGQFRQALALDDSQPAAHLWLGISLFEIDEAEEAARELLKARLLGGTPFAIARFYIAQIRFARDEREKAIRELEAYLEESPRGEKAAEARWLLERLKKET